MSRWECPEGCDRYGVKYHEEDGWHFYVCPDCGKRYRVCAETGSVRCEGKPESAQPQTV